MRIEDLKPGAYVAVCEHLKTDENGMVTQDFTLVPGGTGHREGLTTTFEAAAVCSACIGESPNGWTVIRAKVSNNGKLLTKYWHFVPTRIGRPKKS